MCTVLLPPGINPIAVNKSISLPSDHLTTHSHKCLGPVTPAVIIEHSESGTGEVHIIGQSESGTGAGSYHRTVREWHWGMFIS